MPENKQLKYLISLSFIALVFLAAWIIIRFLLPWVLPFLLAGVIAALIERPIRYLSAKFRIRRSYCSVLCVLTTLVVAGGISVFLAGRVIAEFGAFTQELTQILSAVPEYIADFESGLSRRISAAPKEAQKLIYTIVDKTYEGASQLPGLIAGKALELLSSLASAAPGTVLFIVTFAAGLLFISTGYPDIYAFFRRQFPVARYPLLAKLKQCLFTSLLQWLKAQISLVCITFTELSLGFLLLHVRYALLGAAVVAFIDLLPVLGTGTVLLPWALICIVQRNTAKAVGLAALYCVTATVRSCMEPRLVGAKLGLHPSAALFAMYVGFKSSGIGGMVLFPIALILIKQLNDSGIIRLWK
ncbi:MAG: sporulation integral membrane protein YtvI [Oscillospiraceae bacterium]|nr:sporulation integral membrane protein YtvI [Oscillospiraceae bacterium]